MDKIPNISRQNKKFKSMRETYNLTLLFLKLGMMHPSLHRRHEFIRFILIGVNVLFAVIPCFIIIINDMRIRILKNDTPNLVRQLIIIVCLCFVFMKMILSVVRGKELKEIIDTISRDYESFNKIPKDYQEIVEEAIKKTKIFERIWMAAIAFTAASYPVLAATFTFYSQLFSETPRRYMVHECYVIFLTDEQRFLSPYFEFYNVFAMYTVWMIFIGFTGFDGVFTISIVHVSLKLRLISQDLRHLMDGTNDTSKIKKKIDKFVVQHCEIENFIKIIQRCFEVWLVGVFFNAGLNIAMALSQTSNKGESDINTYIYYFYATATAVHIYLPCYLAADVADNAAEIGNFAYSCSWESISDMRLRKSIAMIINKAQVPIRFRALGMLTYNMELYLKILQTSYTMFTILRK